MDVQDSGDERGAQPTPTVLAVEDEELILWMISSELRVAGWDVIEAKSCGEALAILESGRTYR